MRLAAVVAFAFGCEPATPPAAPVVPSMPSVPAAVDRPGAAYLERIHERLHPVFTPIAEAFEKSAIVPKPRTRVEIVLTASDGALVKMKVVETSGVPVFAVSALQAFKDAQPYGAAPTALASADGNVYVQWELVSGVEDACAPARANINQH